MVQFADRFPSTRPWDRSSVVSRRSSVVSRQSSVVSRRKLIPCLIDSFPETSNLKRLAIQVCSLYKSLKVGSKALLGLLDSLDASGGVLALAVFALFGSQIISLPIVSDQLTTTNVQFLAGNGGQGIMAGQLAMFAFAFGAGILEGYVTPRFARGVARMAGRNGSAG